MECFLNELGLGAAPLPPSGISPGLFPASDPILCCCLHSIPGSTIRHPELPSHPRHVTELEPPAECLISPDLIAMGDQRGKGEGRGKQIKPEILLSPSPVRQSDTTTPNLPSLCHHTLQALPQKLPALSWTKTHVST